jgi:adenylylsulfate kinase
MAMSREGCLVWITGRPQSGKSTFANALAGALRKLSIPTVVIDSDALRAAMTPPPGYDEAGREAFYTTLGAWAVELSAQPLVAIVAATAHKRRFRANAQRLAGTGWVEVYVDAPEAACRERDRKGLYRAADEGRLPELPGVSANLAFEEPDAPTVVASGGHDKRALEEAIAAVAALYGRVRALR